MVVTFEKALKNPANFYVSPQNVLQDQGLNETQKIQILQRWEYDERELAVAEEENMAGGPESKLDEVLLALRRLGATADVGHSPPTKQGGH